MTHVLCCDMDAAVDATESAGTTSLDELYAETQTKFNPRFFGRSQGWSGSTYVDAISFCSLQESMVPCPYEAICPGGPQSMPLGGYNAETEAWAPAIDSPNSWVSIGSKDRENLSTSCMTWSELNSVPPQWGLFPNSQSDITPSGDPSTSLILFWTTTTYFDLLSFVLQGPWRVRHGICIRTHN